MKLTEGLDIVKRLVDGSAQLNSDVPPARGKQGTDTSATEQEGEKKKPPGSQSEVGWMPTHLKDSSELALRKVRSRRVLRNFPQLYVYK